MSDQVSDPSPPALGSLLPGLAEGLHDSEFSLLELADRLLNRGVVIAVKRRSRSRAST